MNQIFTRKAWIGLLVFVAIGSIYAYTTNSLIEFWTAALIPFGTINLYRDSLKHEIRKPIKAYKSWIQKKHTHFIKNESAKIITPIHNIHEIGTNAGRLNEHLDVEFYRNKLRSV